MVDGLDQMMRDGEPEFLGARNLKKLEQMRKGEKISLYLGSNVTKLEADLLLLEMKSSNGLSDKGFDDLLSLLCKLLPSPNELPENTNQTKQMIYAIGLEEQKNHACLVCSTSHYKCDLATMMKGGQNKRCLRRSCDISL